MSKGPDPQSPRDSGGDKPRSDVRRGPRSSGKRNPAPPPAPSLAWAKWIDALGEDEPAPEDTRENAEERLRAATEAAERARLARETTAAAAEETVAPTRARARRSPDQIVVPPRHAPETASGTLFAPLADASTAAQASKSRPIELGPTPPSRFVDADAPKAPPQPAAPTPPPAPDRLGDEPLPDRYEDDRITLICRDPHWLHAYWDLNPASVARARAYLGEAGERLVLRLHHAPALTGQTSGETELEVNPSARNWYLHGGRPGHAFEVEIGLRAADGRFVPLARSNRVSAPLDRVSEVIDEKWRSLAEDDERMYALSGGREAPAASGEGSALMTRRMDEVMGSGLAASFGLWSASAPPPRGVRHPGFWFVLGTELIVYGATDPHATVTCQGRNIPLRPDGTFTLRFALPDGAQEIACRALAADRLHAITITPAVSKFTTREEQRPQADEA